MPPSSPPPPPSIAANASSKSVYTFFHSAHFAHAYFESQCALIHTDGFYLTNNALRTRSLFQTQHFCADASCPRKLKFLNGAFYDKPTPSFLRNPSDFDGSLLRRALSQNWTINMDSLHLWPEQPAVRAQARKAAAGGSHATAAGRPPPAFCG